MAAPMICRSKCHRWYEISRFSMDFSHKILTRVISPNLFRRMEIPQGLKSVHNALTCLSIALKSQSSSLKQKLQVQSKTNRVCIHRTGGLPPTRTGGRRGCRYHSLTGYIQPSLTDDHIKFHPTDIYRRHYSTRPRSVVLGIETSCDDTGAAVVDDSGQIVGEALVSQTKIHVEMGGILPHVASDLHEQNIENVVHTALRNAQLSVEDLDAIACTVKPGLIRSLEVGASYAKQMAKEARKPFIPIHHMEAHALTARMIESVPFPFLVLLISGGHCLLSVVKNVNDFVLIGKSLDDAPGDAFDKTARSLKLKNLPECSGLSGGAAIEQVAKQGDPEAFPLTTVMTRVSNCDFSFAGLKEATRRLIQEQELQHGLGSTDVLPNAADICANFQYLVLHHMAKRLQRGLLFCEMKEYLPRENKKLVVSGGVASNSFIREGLEKVCEQYDCQLICPPPKLCTDNGVMIAWNGMEKWKAAIDIVDDPEDIPVQAKCQLGVDIRNEVERTTLKLKRIKLL